MKPPSTSAPSSAALAEILPDPATLALSLTKADPDQTEVLTWFLCHGLDQGCTNYAELARLLGDITSTTISRVMRGLYGAGLRNICERVAKYRAEVEVTQRLAGGVFVESLSVIQEIREVIAVARVIPQIAIITGRARCGKTEALRHLSREDEGLTYVKIPACGGANKTARNLAKALGIPAAKCSEELWDRIGRKVTAKHVLIFDEFHQVVLGRTMKQTTIERIREIFDDCGCTIILCATNVFEDRIQEKRYRAFLEQIDGRGNLRRRIPDAPTEDDWKALIRAYGLSEAKGEARKTVRDLAMTHGIARLDWLLKTARRKAIKRGDAMTWDDVLGTHSMNVLWRSGQRAEEVVS